MSTNISIPKRIYFGFIYIALTVCFFGVANSVSARVSVLATTTRYVAPSGTDTGECSSATSPCRTIQYAVNQSASGNRILVAQGTYNYNAGQDPCSFLLTRAVICFVDKNLTILGGYSSTNWSTATPSVNLTIVDGNNTYRGVAVIGYNNITTHLNMEGFTIQNGRAYGPTYSNDPSGIGGGMWVQKAAITLKSLTFKNNQAIGADTSSGAGGTADGAGLRIESSPPGTSSLLQHVVFENNQSYGGKGPERGGIAFGALFMYGSTVIVEDSTFTNNLAQAGNSTGNGMSGGLCADALGAGISVENGTITLRRITVTGNQTKGGNASVTGGGAYGAGVFVEDAISFSIADSYVANNTAIAGNAQTGGFAAGGGILAQNSLVTMERVNVISNSVVGGSSTGGGNAGPTDGGGIYILANRQAISRAMIRNVTITDNLAAQGSGNNSLGGGGGGIAIQGIDADVIHATIARNRLGSSLVSGQGLLVLPQPIQSTSLPASVNLDFSIIADHTEGGVSASAILVQQGSTLTFNRGLFAGNTKNTNADSLPVSPGTINGLSTMLIATSAGFVSPGSPYYNYHIRLDSAAKDQAIGSTTADDIDGQSRPYNNVPNLGADEYWPFPLFVSSGDGTLRLDWTTGANVLTGGVDRYEVLATCSKGANPPDQGICGQPINVGTATTFMFTGLNNFKQYTLTVFARDASQNLIATSTTVTTFPTNLLIYLPLVLR
jgi:hypothetical protein